MREQHQQPHGSSLSEGKWVIAWQPPRKNMFLVLSQHSQQAQRVHATSSMTKSATATLTQDVLRVDRHRQAADHVIQQVRAEAWLEAQAP